MLLAKTDKARTALQARSPALNAMDRRVLIVSDGERSRDALLIDGRLRYAESGP